ncbi:MAG: GNAT family N-acetyltransferase [Gemmataceae bacterium]|nr:GNAT family N-acetyltransferase [Gemmataceae bacterium]
MIPDDLCIRPTTPDDVEALVQLTAATGMFKPLELDTLQEIFADYFGDIPTSDQHSRTLVTEGSVRGFVYFAPAPMTDRTWYLYWIVVAADAHGRGYGRALLRHAEDEIRRRGGRVLFIETSGLPHYERTRRFYRQQGYDQEAILRDFYASGDDMIVFRKVL